jgi:hypothetical protein
LRKFYFNTNLPEIENLEGQSSIFLNCKGRPPRATSDFKLNILNKAVFGDNRDLYVTPQNLRKWNTTYLSKHPDMNVRAMRGVVTGNNEIVFDAHYDLTKRGNILEALKTSLQHHQKQDEQAVWSEENEARKERDLKAICEANDALLLQSSGVDMTSKKRPVHAHLRHKFQLELEHLDPGLWSKACSKARGNISEMKWIYQIVKLLGQEDAENLRGLILDQYRGDENPAKRRWSGLRSHIESINQDKIKGEGTSRNCPLIATLKLFYSSARAKNKFGIVKGAVTDTSGTSDDDDCVSD